MQVTSRFLLPCLPSSFFFLLLWTKDNRGMSDGSGDRGAEIGKFWHTYLVGNFLNKISSPAGLDESHVFDIDGRLHGETSSTCNEELQSDFNTWLGWLGTCSLHGWVLSKALRGSLLDTWNSPFHLHFPACNEPQIPRPHTTSPGFRNQSLFLGKILSHLFLDIFFNSHTHAHTLLCNEHDEGERKKGEGSKGTDRSWLLSQVSLLLWFMGLWFWSLSPIWTFKLPITGGKGGEKRAASLSLCLNLLFTWKSVRLTQTSLTCQRAAAGRGVFDL